MLGFDAIGRLAFGQISSQTGVTTVLSVTPGAYAVTGVSVTFQETLRVAPAAFTVTGNAVSLLALIQLRVDAAAFHVTGNPVALTRTGADFDLTYGGIGHFLLAQEEARKLAAITREVPPPVDRRTAPAFAPLARPYSAPPAPVVDMAAIQNERMAAQAAAVQATKKRRELEAILLLAS